MRTRSSSALALIAFTAAAPILALACGPTKAPARVVAPALSASTSSSAPIASLPIASSAPPPSAIEGALPTAAVGAFPRSIECATRPRCNHPQLVPPGDRPEGESPGFFWEERWGDGKGLAFPRVAEVELYGVVLEGAPTLSGDDEPPKSARTLAPWSAFRASGAGIVLGGAGRVVLLAIARGGEPIARVVASLAREPNAHGWSKRAAPIATRELATVPALDWGGGAYHARLAFEATAADVIDDGHASLGLLLASRDAPVKEHVHDKEWELLAVLDGAGEMVERTLAGEHRTKIDGPTFLAVPAGEPHGFAPAGTRPLIAIQAYTPPGPEQRFRALAASAAASGSTSASAPRR